LFFNFVIVGKLYCRKNIEKLKKNNNNNNKKMLVVKKDGETQQCALARTFLILLL